MENNQKKEVNEALHAIEETLGHLSRAQDYLSSAGNWGLFDMIGGGFITTMIKHGKMNEAERAMAAARNSIRNLKKELSDWMVQSKIKDARFQVDKAIRELNRIKNTLLTLAV